MIFPSLLFTDSEFSLPKAPDEEFFIDIKLSGIFDFDTKRILSVRCSSADEIFARQSFFQALNNNAFLNELNSLLNILSETAYQRRHYESAKSEAEASVYYLNYAKAFYKFAEESVYLGGTGFFNNRFRDFWQADAICIHTLDDEIKRASDALTRINSCILSSDDKQLLISQYDVDKNKQESFPSILRRCAYELGLEPRKISTSTSKPSVYLISALESLYKNEFYILRNFRENAETILNPSLLNYITEINYYISIRKFYEKLINLGYPMTYPTVSKNRKLKLRNAYEISLALKSENKSSVVPNDADFDENGSFFFLTGANGGGKTTFIRTVAQCLVLFIGGCPIPCENADIYPFTTIFTHFPKDERFDSVGRLEEEKLRVDEIFKKCNADSFSFFNETFSGTEENTAISLTIETANKFSSIPSFGIYVTHFHEVAECGIPVMNVLVDENDANRRTFKVMRSAGIKNSYAEDILRKYALSKYDLVKRLNKHQGYKDPVI
ncbi:DNA mismatch repair protein MutS [bioreactor metagenome]|uniref:DNA mismatch repair protein MutS n=1 Tax=bioreactor metagenome TaxID=1076179 RepID=A0A645BZD2_9ZZZZ|nr:hypothetical protein [Oscillospiraceae bacterium]